MGRESRMKAYCINLDRRPDRLEHMTVEFQRAGIPFARISAVDAQDPAVAAAAGSVPLSMQKARISPGAYACLQSHRLAWHRMLQEGHSHAAVFEDDVLLAPDIGFLGTEDWVPPDADVVKLETFRTRVQLSRRRQTAVPGWDLARMISAQVGAAAYVLRAKTAMRLLAVTESLCEPVDQMLFNGAYGFSDHAVIYQMIPAPAVQGDRVGPDKQKAKTGWQATSIPERHDLGQGRVDETAEGMTARLFRRLREEGRSLWEGTHYVVVPHGQPKR
jgi:glycosyl transferase, family 25